MSASWFRIFIILILIGTMGGSFYWFQYRPTEIKKQCATKIVTKPAIPFRPALSEEQLVERNLVKVCPTEAPECDEIKPGVVKAISCLDRLFCQRNNNEARDKYKYEQKAVSDKQEVVRTSEEEYSLCLRDNGL